MREALVRYELRVDRIFRYEPGRVVLPSQIARDLLQAWLEYNAEVAAGPSQA